MKITKLGHSCLVLNINGVKIIIDPGKYSLPQVEEKNVNIILITHEHTDHFHLESVQAIIKNNPLAEIITNASVGKILEKENIKYSIVKNGQKITSNNILIAGIGELHKQVYLSIPQVEDVGFLINKTFFYPGDALHKLDGEVDVVAFPVAGSWLKVSEVVDWLKELKPKVAIPVHDAILNENGKKAFLGNYQKLLANLKILELGKEEEF